MSLEKLDPIEINFMGEDKAFRYTLYSFAQYKRLTGNSLLTNFDPTDPETLFAYIWVGMIQDDSKLDERVYPGKKPEKYLKLEEKFLRNNDFKLLEEYSIAIQEALERSLPKKEEKSEHSKKKE